MISRVVIRGFQRHKRLELSLDPRITTIVGPSDRGKSAILRALRWVLLNEAPKGRIIHWEERAAAVSLFLGKKRITRARGRGNHYHLNNKKYSAFGKEVPKDIAQLANVGHLNFQAQQERAFWFSLSPAEVSRQLNAIVDLGAIDTTLAKLAAMLRHNRAEQRVGQQRLEEAREDRHQHSAALGAHHQLKQLEKRERALALLKEQRERLEHLLEEAESTQAALARLERAEEAWESLERLEALSAGLAKTQDSHAALEKLLAEIEYQDDRYKKLKHDLHCGEEELASSMGEECPLCGRSDRNRSR